MTGYEVRTLFWSLHECWIYVVTVDWTDMLYFFFLLVVVFLHSWRSNELTVITRLILTGTYLTIQNEGHIELNLQVAEI